MRYTKRPTTVPYAFEIRKYGYRTFSWDASCILDKNHFQILNETSLRLIKDSFLNAAFMLDLRISNSNRHEVRTYRTGIGSADPFEKHRNECGRSRADSERSASGEPGECEAGAAVPGGGGGSAAQSGADRDL